MRVCPQCRKTFEDAVDYCPNDGTKMTSLDAGIPGAQVHGAGTVLGAYRVLRLLGSGGMGQVYLAEHTRLGRKVAIKILHADRANDPQAVKRFFAEARAVNQINQENIVQITDFIEDDGAEKYYIMEYLEGATLAAVLKQEGGVSLARAVRITMQVCRALGAVHAAGIVHRDLKPDNVFLTPRLGNKDFVKLLDFGVAKLVNAESGESVGNTAAFAVLGTPEYMSPEQLGGSAVDYRTDIYALGIILYELVTARKPFVGSTFGDYVIKHSTIAPVPPGQIPGVAPMPAQLEALVLRCLAKDAEDRPQSMSVIESELREVLAVLPDGDAADVARSPLSRFATEILARLERIPAGAKALGVGRRGYRRLWALPGLIELPARYRPAASFGALGVVLTGMLMPVFASDDTAAGPPLVQAPAVVRISIVSTPPGAAVWRDDVVLGNTPLTLELAQSATAAELELRKPGHRPARAQVSLAQDGQVNVVLARTVASGKKARRDNDRDRDKPKSRKNRRGVD